jgi:hypothetical protein
MRHPATPTIREHPIQADQAQFAWWLVGAVFLHALLLLIPARQTLSPGPSVAALTVVLSRTWHGAPPTRPAEKRQTAQNLPAAESPPAIAPAIAPAETLPVAPALEAPLPSPGDMSPPVTTARLLDFAHRREWNMPEPPVAPGPGAFKPQPAPPDWRPVVTAKGAARPVASGIVDQWLAADGSRNVMIRTPTGQLLCGRAEAWNPMSPLVEPVMMYRACGDGRRTFEMPERVLLR